MSATQLVIAEIKRRNAIEPSLIDAAKVVVALTGWDQERQCTVTSMMAVDVLRKAIEREENPVLRLAPEPINAGVL